MNNITGCFPTLYGLNVDFITWILQKNDATEKFQSIPKQFCHEGVFLEFHVSKISNVKSVADLK